MIWNITNKNGSKINEPYSKFQNRKVLTLADVLEDIEFFRENDKKGHESSKTNVDYTAGRKGQQIVIWRYCWWKYDRIWYQSSLKKFFLLAGRRGK